MNEDLYFLLIFSLINVKFGNVHCMKKMFDKMRKPQILFSFVFQNQIVGKPIFYQRYGNSILFIQMLLEKQGGKRFADTFEFCIESTVVERYLFNNTRALDVVVICTEL